MAYTEALAKQIKPDVLQFIQNATESKSFINAKHPESQENKVIAMLSAVVAHKRMLENKLAETIGLLNHIQKILLKLRARLRKAKEAAMMSPEAEEEKEQRKRDERAHLKQLKHLLEESRDYLITYLANLTTTYNNCVVQLKENSIGEVTQALSDELNMPVSREASEAIHDIYATREEVRVKTLNNLEKMGVVLPTLPTPKPGKPAATAASTKEAAALEHRIDVNFDVGTQVLVVGFLRNLASTQGVVINLANILAASNRADGLINLYRQLTTSLAKTFDELSKQGKDANSRIEPALEQLKEALKTAPTPSPAPSRRVWRKEDEENVAPKKFSPFSKGAPAK